MSNGDIRKVSRQDIQLVQNLIEQCLQLYMSQKEVVNALFVQEKIEPSFTELVWQKLEEDNQEFFKAYYMRLLVKEQIMEFNSLLARHVELKHQVGPAGVAFIPMSNGSHIPQIHQNSACYAPAVDMSANSRRIDVSPNMVLAQSSNVGTIQGMNGGMIKTEASYAGDSQFIFGVNGNVLETRSAIGDASASSFSNLGSNSQPLNANLLDADSSSFGFLGQISRNCSLSDLTADFSNSFDIMESYSRSPFLATDTDNFLNSHSRGERHGDDKRLDALSEGLNYEDFGSD